MEINPLLQAITTVTLTSNTTILPEIRNWQTGQLLEAIATSQSQNGQVKLQVGPTQFEVRVQFPVEPGQKLVLEVIKQADPPILQLAQTDTNKNAIINAALRAILPKQVPGISPLLSNISFLSSQSVQQRSALSPEILVLARTFFNLLPDVKRVSTPDGLRQTINNSGIFLENKLATKHSATNNGAVKQDLKAGLLQLRQAIQALSQHQTPAKTESTQASSQKIPSPTVDGSVVKRVLSNSSPNNKSTVDYPSAIKPILNKAIENLSATGLRGEMPLTNKTLGNLPGSNKLFPSNNFVNNKISGNTVAGKFNLNNPAAFKSSTNAFPADNVINRKHANHNNLSARTSTYKAFTFTPVTSNSYSGNLASSRFLFNKSVINHLLIRNQHPGKTFEQTVANTRNAISADKQPISSTPDTRTNIRKALDIARNISDQVRDTAKTIRNTLGTPRQITSGSGSATGTSNIPGISTLFNAQNLPGSSQASREEILKALPGSEDLNYLQTKKGPPLAQSRTQATVNQMSSIDQLITTLLKDVESSLARIQFHQLNTQQPQDTDTKQAWVMELPVRKEDGADIFRLHIEKDAQQQTDTEPENKFAWTIRLSFTLEGLGPVHTRISLSGDKISTIFWLEEKHTTDLFQKHLSELQENLARAGINIEKLNCLNGRPPETEKYFFPQQLLHEKA